MVEVIFEGCESKESLSDEETKLMGDYITQQNGASSIVREIPPFIVDDNTKKIQRDKLQAYFANLTAEAVANQIIAACLNMANSPTFCMSFGVTNLAKEILPKFIVKDDRF